LTLTRTSAVGIVGLIILACMALARVLAWYVFRFGRRQLDEQSIGRHEAQPVIEESWLAASRFRRHLACVS
jgi:hypothetical protein